MTIRTLSVAFMALMAAAPALAAEPDGLILPSGFHATVVAEGVGPVRHMALRGNDIYVSTRHGANAPSVGTNRALANECRSHVTR